LGRIHSEREEGHDATVFNIKRAQGFYPSTLSPSQEDARDQSSFTSRGLPSKGEARALPPPEVASNLQPVLRHAGIVSAQNWLTGELTCLCGGVANGRELEPLWLAALLLKVPEVFGCYISLHSARSACGLTVLGQKDGGNDNDGRRRRR
jgi:hypothetical protein